ncbi:MAG: 23S rRNA pseudouridine(955/2504/2580) synthase RluC [Gammaproteobacteria bacterium]
MPNTHKQSQVSLVEVDAEYAGQRIDNFLLGRLKGAPRSLVYRILRKGEVRVNKGRIKPEYRLQAGDIVRIPPVKLPEAQAPGLPGRSVLAAVEAGILYEDERLLVLNKPSGLAVHGGSGIHYGAIEALRILRPKAKRLELVHRLDRDTSGCLVVTKRGSSLRSLHEQFRDNRVQKTYLALVKGRWQGGPRTIDAPLKKNIRQSGERMVKVDSEGKASISIFTPLAVTDEASLLQVELKTGRTHQIRVHAQHAGYPLAGDEKYGDEAFNRQLRARGLRRLFLHAQRLCFEFPPDNQRGCITAPLEDELKKVLSNLGIDADAL